MTNECIGAEEEKEQKVSKWRNVHTAMQCLQRVRPGGLLRLRAVGVLGRSDRMRIRGVKSDIPIARENVGGLWHQNATPPEYNHT